MQANMMERACYAWNVFRFLRFGLLSIASWSVNRELPTQGGAMKLLELRSADNGPPENFRQLDYVEIKRLSWIQIRSDPHCGQFGRHGRALVGGGLDGALSG